MHDDLGAVHGGLDSLAAGQVTGHVLHPLRGCAAAPAEHPDLAAGLPQPRDDRRYQASRPRLRAMAYRMLGSLSDGEDAVQEAWIHTARAGADGVDNLEGWFTTIVSRVCLDMLRSRKSRREEPLDPDEAVVGGPEQEAILADSVGLALFVVLDQLAPAERVAFALHDTFGLPFGEIAAITGRSPAAAR